MQYVSNMIFAALALAGWGMAIASIFGFYKSKKKRRGIEAQSVAVALCTHIAQTYPKFFGSSTEYNYIRTKGNIELDATMLPELVPAFARYGVNLVCAGPEAAVDCYHMQLEHGGNTIGVKAYRKIN